MRSHYILPWILCLITACTRPDLLQQFAGQAQGTTYHVHFYSRASAGISDLQNAVDVELALIDQTMSGYRPDSTIEKFNRTDSLSSYQVGSEIISLIRTAEDTYKVSNGCHDLTIKPLFDLWGFSDDRFSPPEQRRINSVMQFIGMDQIDVLDNEHIRKRNPSVKVDLSSVAQGYTAERMAAVLDKRGIYNYMVEIGGEIVTSGKKPDGQPWRIAIERPLAGERRVEKVVVISGGKKTAVVTSGTYRHYFDRNGRRYSHILDARGGYPVTHDTVSVTVIHRSATIADAWSTALLCLGREAGLAVAEEHGIPALFIQANSQGLKESRSAPLARLDHIEIE